MNSRKPHVNPHHAPIAIDAVEWRAEQFLDALNKRDTADIIRECGIARQLHTAGITADMQLTPRAARKAGGK